MKNKPTNRSPLQHHFTGTKYDMVGEREEDGDGETAAINA